MFSRADMAGHAALLMQGSILRCNNFFTRSSAQPTIHIAVTPQHYIMGRLKKSTRKFEAKHLTRTLDDRKAKAKLKQQFILREKKKKKNQDRKDGSDSDQGNAAKKSKELGSENLETIGDMSVEEFFQKGFEVPELKTKPAKTKSSKRKRDNDDESKDVASDSEASDNDSTSEDEVSKHKGDLSALAEKDPEFHKYLKENDPELLDFSMAEKDDLSAVDELSEGEDLTGKKNKKGRSINETAEVTMADVKKWKNSMVESHSLRALRQVVLAFRAAAHGNDDEEEAGQGGFKYLITNPDVYHELMLLALKSIPDVLNHHLPIKESQSGKIRVATETKKYRTLTPLLKSHSASLLHLLPLLTDAPTQKLLLNSTLSFIPYCLTFRKFLKSFLKAVVEIWSSNSTDEATRITAFLVVRKVTVIGDEGMKEICFKALYAGFVRASRKTTMHTIQGVNLMKNSAAEIVGLPGMEKVGYQSGFAYIRQLAIHLRKSITNNSKDSYKEVYNSQYVHSLDFWSRALAMHCDGLKEAQAGKESTLRPLIYPLVQVTLGAIRLIPTAQFFPLRFFLIRSLLRVSLATGAYIPLAPLIYEVLTSAEMKKKPKPSTLKPLDFSVTIQTKKEYLRTRTYQDGLAEQIVELFAEFFVLYTKSVAFPEVAIPIIVQVKRFMKKSKNAKLNGALNLLISKLEQNSSWIEEKRSKIEFAPNKREQVDAFLKDYEWEKTPLGVYVMSQRMVRDEKRRILEESQREEREREQKDRSAEEEMEADSNAGEEDDSEDDPMDEHGEDEDE